MWGHFQNRPIYSQSTTKGGIILLQTHKQMSYSNRKSMSSSSSSSSGGIGFIGLLQILFIGLKLTGYINWSWWWVMSPFIISTAIGLTILAVVFGVLIYSEMQK